MDFTETNAFIERKLKGIKLPYFSCLVKKDGKEIFKYEQKFDSDKTDLLDMYSMSKPVTVVAFMQLVQQGLIDLNDDVDKYIPGFTNLFEIKTNKKINNKIKIWNLLSMTSGLDYNLERKAIKDYVAKYPQAGTIEICSLMAKDGILFEPGEGYFYSLSIDVIAAIIEIITKTKFSEYIKTNIFDRLGMKNSTFKQDLELSEKCHCEYGYADDMIHIAKCRDHMYKSFFPSTNYESGGAGLISTVEDYSLFVESLANRTSVLLNDKFVDEIATPRVLKTPLCEEVQRYYYNSDEYGYGLGVRVRKEDTIEGLPAGEFGWEGAAGSYCLVDRKNHISIVIGLTLRGWPDLLKDFHINLVKSIYKKFL